MIREFLCWLRSRHAYCIYHAHSTVWTCRCGLREQTDREWIQEIFSS